MLPIPPAALAALTGPAARPVSAEWSNDGGKSWTAAPSVISGEVRADAGAECRYSGPLSLTGVPRGADGTNTAVTRVRLWQGLRPPRTETYWVPAGTYVVDHLARTRLGVDLDLLGLEDVIRGARLPVARTIGPDTARALVEQLVGEALPGASISWRPGVRPDKRMPRMTVDEDRWQALVDIAAALAGRVWVDARGVVTIGPEPTLAAEAVWRIPYGTAVVEPAEEETAEDLVNLWTVTGDGGDGSPVIGPVFAWDDDPHSITYAGPDPVEDPGAPQRLGLAHVRVRADRYSSPLITDAGQADEVAQSRLAASLGVRSSLAFTVAGHPGLEPGDVAEVEVRPGEWQRHIIDACPYTLGRITQSCTTRTTSRRL